MEKAAEKHSDEVEHGSIRIVGRGAWGAAPPTAATEPLPVPVDRVVMEYAECEPCTSRQQCIARLKELQERAIAQGQPDLPYNFVVGGDKGVYECRGWRTKVEDNRIVIGLLGKQNGGEEDYNDKVEARAFDFMLDAVWLYYVKNIIQDRNELIRFH